MSERIDGSVATREYIQALIESGNALFKVACFNWDLKKRSQNQDTSALMNFSGHLWDKSVLEVSFLNDPPAFAPKQTIIRWMNEWSKGNEKIVPTFKEVDNNGDIRILFTDQENSHSSVGTLAPKPPSDKPTMTLNLNVLRPKVEVLHETGHALGFGHDHQNPKFAGMYNKKAIMDEIKEEYKYTDEEAENLFEANFKVTSSPKGVYYDEHSIMMYRIKKSWVHPEFHKYYSDHEEGDFLVPHAVLREELTDNDLMYAKKWYQERAQNAVQQPNLLGIFVGTMGSLPSHSVEPDSAGDVLMRHTYNAEYTRKLDLKDHNAVQSLLKDKVTVDEIVNLGSSLGLNRIKLVNLGAKVLGDMVMMWLRKDNDVLKESGYPTIKILVEHLKKNEIGIADEIERKYRIEQ